jgi:hypothetical protein
MFRILFLDLALVVSEWLLRNSENFKQRTGHIEKLYVLLCWIIQSIRQRMFDLHTLSAIEAIG